MICIKSEASQTCVKPAGVRPAGAQTSSQQELQQEFIFFIKNGRKNVFEPEKVSRDRNSVPIVKFGLKSYGGLNRSIHQKQQQASLDPDFSPFNEFAT